MSGFQKGFYRLKHQVTETLDKNATKTAALSEELREVEEDVKKIKLVYTDALKRAQESLPSYQHFRGIASGATVDAEKRMRKQVTWALGNTLVEGSTAVEESHFLFDTLKFCGDTLVLIAKQSVRFEYDLHEQVITPMQEILSEIKEIDILKKKLTNARLDMDSSNHTLQKRKVHLKGGQELDATLMANAENATNQFQMAQDTYVTALLSFSSKELDHIRPLQCLLTCQQKMFNDVSKILNAKLPSLQDSIEKTANTPVYGTDLEKHLEISGRSIATPLKKCCSSLMRSGIEQPGIFRLAGGLPQLRKLKAMFDSNRMEEDEWQRDVFTLAQAIKLYLRELPEPLLTFDMFEDWISCIGNPKVPKRITRCKELVQKLPTSFQINLQYLIWFLNEVASRESENKMGASNLGLVLGPNVLRTKNEDDSDSITALNASAGIVELMIRNYATIFPEPLPADATRCSLPRTMTVSGPSPISSSRPSVRSHKKGKAPTPLSKKGSAPAPAPNRRLDLDQVTTSPGPAPPPVTPVKPRPPPVTTATPAANPFDSDEDTPDPPKRTLDGRNLNASAGNLNASIPIPEAEDNGNPFNSPTPDDSKMSAVLGAVVKDEDEDSNPFSNPFGDSDTEESAANASPTPPPSPVKAPAPPVKAPASPIKAPAPPAEPSPKPVKAPTAPTEPSPKPKRPTPPPAKRPTPPPPTPKPKPPSMSSPDDTVELDATGSPTFCKHVTPSHSRSTSSTSSIVSAEGKGHSRNTSDVKPAPPPRLSLDP